MIKQGTLIPNTISLAPIVQILYIIAISYPGISSTSFLEGSNITNFFTRYNLIYSDFPIEEKTKSASY